MKRESLGPDMSRTALYPPIVKTALMVNSLLAVHAMLPLAEYDLIPQVKKIKQDQLWTNANISCLGFTPNRFDYDYTKKHQ